MTTPGFAPGGIALILAGAFIRAIYVINSKRNLRDLSPRFVTVVQSLVCSALLALMTVLWYPASVEDWFSPAGVFWPLAATAVLNIAVVGGELFALGKADASLVAPISATAPLFSLLTGLLILGELPRPIGWFGVALVSLGLYLLSGSKPAAAETDGTRGWRRHLHTLRDFLLPWRLLPKNAGVRLALLSALAGSIAINFDKIVVQKSSPTFLPMAVLAFVGLVMAATLRRADLPRLMSGRATAMLLLSPALYAAVILLFNLALTQGPASYSSALRRTSILFVILLSGPLLKERGHPERVVAGCLMALGAALLVL